MITLYLVSKGILKRPLLYLSAFLEKHRTLYYDNLMKVRFQNDIDQWLKFFLTGVIETAQKGVDTLQKIMYLKEDIEKKCDTLGKRGIDARILLNYLYKKPIISVAKAIELIHKTPQTAYTLIADMEKLGILKEITHTQRNKLYCFSSYINLFETL
ncbi:MAG: hypothetical protein LBM25_03430 [Bacteroidales bacterium]|jgi:Fic family protein|nr:hypothetical protein [Bacteroidales bacterium]